MDKQLKELETHLVNLVQEHEALLGLIERKLEALRMAKPDLVTDCCGLENDRVQRIAALEKRRLDTVGRITEVMAPSASEPLSLTEIAQRTHDERGTRLMVLRAKLRGLMDQIQKKNGVARRATEGLLGHVSGIMQQVTHAMAGGGAYNRRGTVGGSVLTTSSFSITG
ncbi:MAG: flagellar export chaperone FlgN [Planctomycetota bacterium]|jgi:hypothetical protein